ncbi:hypothetical protein KC345_g4459 [Hortaea werneckii]|nr:hypothetical protein KC345_g4459 [Hortaea werneckii]
MVIVLEYEQAEIKLRLKVEVELLLIVLVVELGTTDGRGLALCAYVELKEDDANRVLVLVPVPVVLSLLVKLIVAETGWKLDDDELLTCELVEGKLEESAALDTDVEAEVVPKLEDDEFCVDDALRMTKLDVIDEKEVADNDVEVAGSLLGWVEVLERVAEKEDVVLRLKSLKEEGDVERDADGSGLLLSMGDELDSSKGTEEEVDREEDVAEKLGSMLEELKVSIDDEEDVVESENTGAWLYSAPPELDAEGIVNRSEGLPDNPRLDSPEEDDEPDEVEMYAVVLLTSTSAVLA